VSDETKLSAMQIYAMSRSFHDVDGMEPGKRTLGLAGWASAHGEELLLEIERLQSIVQEATRLLDEYQCRRLVDGLDSEARAFIFQHATDVVQTGVDPEIPLQDALEAVSGNLDVMRGKVGPNEH
jgi:hypothetical protein